MVLGESRSMENSMAVDCTRRCATFRRPMLSVADRISGMLFSVRGIGFSGLWGPMVKRSLLLGEIRKEIRDDATTEMR
jgi:hypothetical protein